MASDPVVDALAEWAATAERPVVLIDGGSGAGKSTLASRLAVALHAQLVRLEDIYPGWDGLEAASVAVHRDVLAGPELGWRSWDWTRAEPSDWHPIDPTLPLVVEGSGSLSRRNRQLATFGIWLELAAGERKSRALTRDGETYSPHWDRWAAQEALFAAREHPKELADAVVDVASGRVRRNPPSASA
ncbi:MAG: ATP-binding protein [Galbitalea sp.]